MNQIIDVVYKLGTGSKFNDIELRYSLRSLKNFLPLGKVFITGHCPEWVNKENIIHILATDPYTQNKDGNLINKLILTSQHPDITDSFLNISDDQLFLQECNYEEISIPYINNKHLIVISNERIARWQTRLLRTVDKLKNLYLPSECFESHLPCLLKKDFASVLFRYDYGFDRGYCGNTLYYNTLRIKGKELEENTLVRLIEPIINKDTLEKMCENKRYLNMTDKAVNDNLLLYLQKLFPEKSKYET